MVVVGVRCEACREEERRETWHFLVLVAVVDGNQTAFGDKERGTLRPRASPHSNAFLSTPCLSSCSFL